MTRIERVVTAGIFELDGQQFDVENNIWLIGDDDEVIVIDAAHDHRPIVEAVAGRSVAAIVLTDGHNDHINAGPALAEEASAPLLLHPDDLVLWREVFPSPDPDGPLAHGMRLMAGAAEVEVIHTPGHTPGGCCVHHPATATLFGGDTLFRGGPGATGRRLSDFPTIITSIRERLLALPAETTVHPGHGDSTTIGEEAPHLDEWIARGH